MTDINILHALAPGCHPQGVFQIKGIQSQQAKLGMHCPHWNGYNIKILKYIKLISTKLQCCDIKTM